MFAEPALHGILPSKSAQDLSLLGSYTVWTNEFLLIIWRSIVCLKCQQLFTRQHGITSQKTWIILGTSVGIYNRAYNIYSFLHWRDSCYAFIIQCLSTYYVGGGGTNSDWGYICIRFWWVFVAWTLCAIWCLKINERNKNVYLSTMNYK